MSRGYQCEVNPGHESVLGLPRFYCVRSLRIISDKSKKYNIAFVSQD